MYHSGLLVKTCKYKKSIISERVKMVRRLQEMVQGDDSMDHNLYFALSLGKCET